MKSKLIKVMLILILLISLIRPQQTLLAAQEGLLLWFNIILPSLLPFMIISNLIIHLNMVHHLSKLLSPITKKLFKLPGASGYALSLGLLSGFPMGAKVTGDLVKTNHLSKEDGNYLLSFCNNASPMFILGFVAAGELKTTGFMGLQMLLIIYSSSILTGLLLSLFRITKGERNIKKSKTLHTQSYSSNSIFKQLDTCIMDGFELIVKIGGYIILFSILLNMLQLVPIPNPLIKYLLLGTIEMSNGVHLIANLQTTIEIKAVLATTIVSFGGFSILAQTQSVLQDSGLSIFRYLFGKIINTLLSFLLALFLFIIL